MGGSGLSDVLWLWFPGGVLRDEEVEKCERDGVSREHVVPAGPHTLHIITRYLFMHR